MKDWHILITGGSSGIGLSLAEKLHEQGATLHLTGRSQNHLDAVGQRLSDRVHTYLSDTADGAARVSLMEAVAKNSGGRLDGLVVNAARYGFVPMLEQDVAEFEHYFQTNTIAAFHMVQLAHPLLLNGEGRGILFISSTLANRPIAGVGAYAASKAAMNSLAQSWALELAVDKIRVNAILPGVVNTPIHEPQSERDLSREEKMAQLAAAHPIGRVGVPGDVAEAGVFLLSQRAEWITGSLFFVDGGISLV